MVTTPIPAGTDVGALVASTTQPISATSLPLPTGAATDTKLDTVRALLVGVAADATLQAILTKLGTARVETLFTDDSGTFFVRVDNAGVITWTDTSGNASAAPGVGQRPAAGATVLLDKSAFTAIAAATGYSIGDYLDHIITTDPGSGAVIGNFWINSSTGLKLAAAPASANISPISPLATGAATLVAQIAGNTSLTAIATAIAALLASTNLTTAATNFAAIVPSDTVPVANVATMKSLYVTVAGNLAIKGSATGAAPVIMPVVIGQTLPFAPTYVMQTNTTATVIGLL